MATKNFDDLFSKMSPERQARAQAKAKAMLGEMALGELRRARALTQESLASKLGTTQSEVSKIEQRTDVYVSTLRRYIESTGGELRIVASYPEGEVAINQFQMLRESGEYMVEPSAQE